MKRRLVNALTPLLLAALAVFAQDTSKDAVIAAPEMLVT
jgi:hypothetical protein